MNEDLRWLDFALLTIMTVFVIFAAVTLHLIRRDVQEIRRGVCTHAESSVAYGPGGEVIQPPTMTGCLPEDP